MKISFPPFAGAALALALAAATAAAADTGAPTIYGIVDASVSRDTGRYAAGATTTLGSGGAYGSRLGLRGTEPLGPGLAALFELESGFNVDDGTLAQGANLLFGRKALVGLRGPLGSVKLGRQDSPLYSATVNFDPFREGVTGAYTRVMGAISSLRRNDNTVAYTPPALGPLRAELAYSAGERAGGAGRGAAASLTYADGPLSVAWSAQNANSKPVAPAPVVATRLRALGASYAFGWATASVLASTTRTDAGADVRDVLLGAAVPLGAGLLQLSYIVHRDRAAAGADARQGALGYVRPLSPRTGLYGRYARIGNGPDGRLGLAARADGGAAAGTTERLVTLGCYHFF